MSQCVKVLPAGTDIGGVQIAMPLIAVDPSCTSGLVVVDQSDNSVDSGRIADMAALFYAFVAVFVLVWGAKQLLSLFTGDTSRD